MPTYFVIAGAQLLLWAGSHPRNISPKREPILKGSQRC